MPETPAQTIEDETRPARPAATLHEHILSALARGREIYTGWRQRRLVGTQICVTGSCGKSTAVRLISHMLAGEGTLHVLTHPNNDKHLLRPHRRRRQPVDFVVQEVSGYAPGAIAPLARSLRVDIAVITSVGTDHETSYRPSRIGMTMLEGVAREKGRLAAAVHVGGTVCLSADDPLVAGMAGRCRGRVVIFGTAEGADFRAINIELDWPQRIRFDLVAKGSVYPVVANFASRIMLPSVIGALAAAHAAGVDLEVAISRLAGAQPIPQHMSVHEGTDGRTYVLDTFKASRWSVLRLADDLATVDRRFAVVIGDIADMGGNSGTRYRQLIRKFALVADEVILTGTAGHYGRKLPGEHPNIVLAPTLEDVAAHIAQTSHRLVFMKANLSSGLARAALPAGIDVLGNSHA
jgi:UDP-N-acetylmuramoyl-tripeptide--D-alanyl-D-alanine ligase